MSRQQALYRFFDAAGELLYVGITVNPSSRWPDHMKSKPWWTEVTNITLETHPDRASVEAAERSAIQAEAPRYNVVHNRRRGSAAEPPREPGEIHSFRVGDVVALGLIDCSCPVGQVAEVGTSYLTLDAYSWLTEHFGHTEVLIPLVRVSGFKHARELDPGIARSLGYLVEPDCPIWNMEPLADFQAWWMAA